MLAAAPSSPWRPRGALQLVPPPGWILWGCPGSFPAVKVKGGLEAFRIDTPVLKQLKSTECKRPARTLWVLGFEGLVAMSPERTREKQTAGNECLRNCPGRLREDNEVQSTQHSKKPDSGRSGW